MIDHMLMNQTKYYPSQVPNYIGRKTIAPKKGKIMARVQHNQVYSSTGVVFSAFTYGDDTVDLTPSQLKDKKILGQALGDNGGWYIFIVVSFWTGTEYDQNCIAIPLDQLLQNGGVSHSHLTHSYRASHLVRKEISMALMKMKYQLKDWYQGLRHLLDRKVALVND